MDENGSNAEHLCHKCGCALEPGRGRMYVVRIEAVADPYPPVITAEDLAADPAAQMQKLVEQMEGMSERELRDQVARSLRIELCNGCYGVWIEDPTG